MNSQASAHTNLVYWLAQMLNRAVEQQYTHHANQIVALLFQLIENHPEEFNTIVSQPITGGIFKNQTPAYMLTNALYSAFAHDKKEEIIDSISIALTRLAELAPTSTATTLSMVLKNNDKKGESPLLKLVQAIVRGTTSKDHAHATGYITQFFSEIAKAAPEVIASAINKTIDEGAFSGFNILDFVLTALKQSSRIGYNENTSAILNILMLLVNADQHQTLIKLLAKKANKGIYQNSHGIYLIVMALHAAAFTKDNRANVDSAIALLNTLLTKSPELTVAALTEILNVPRFQGEANTPSESALSKLIYTIEAGNLQQNTAMLRLLTCIQKPLDPQSNEYKTILQLTTKSTANESKLTNMPSTPFLFSHTTQRDSNSADTEIKKESTLSLTQ